MTGFVTLNLKTLFSLREKCHYSWQKCMSWFIYLIREFDFMYSDTGRPQVLDIVSFKYSSVEILYCITMRSRWGIWNSISRMNIESILIEGSKNAYRTALKTFRCRGGNSNGIFHTCTPRYYISMIPWGVFSGRSIFIDKSNSFFICTIDVIILGLNAEHFSKIPFFLFCICLPYQLARNCTFSIK